MTELLNEIIDDTIKAKYHDTVSKWRDANRDKLKKYSRDAYLKRIGETEESMALKKAGRPSHNLTDEQKKQRRRARHLRTYVGRGQNPRKCEYGNTYGEAWVEYLRVLNTDDRIDNRVTMDDSHKQPPHCPIRMRPQQAKLYYKTKLQAVWDELYPSKPRDFLKLDDYFDSFEAQRAVNNLILGNMNEKTV